MEHLARKGLACPTPIHARSGEALGQLCGRPAAIISFLEGMWPRRPTPRHCQLLGEALARFPPRRRRLHHDAARTICRSPAGGRCSKPAARGPMRSLPASPTNWRASSTTSERHWPRRSRHRHHPCRSFSRQRLLPAGPALGDHRFLFRLHRFLRLRRGRLPERLVLRAESRLQCHQGAGPDRQLPQGPGDAGQRRLQRCRCSRAAARCASC